MEKSIFKAYDVRGKYPTELNEEAVLEISKALRGYFLKAKSSQALPAGRRVKAQIVIGHDARLSSPTLYRAVIKGFRVKGLGDRKNIKKNLNPLPLTLYPAGLITTPMLYFLVNKLKADGGIMVTASHNPKEYNGLKVVGKNARPISGREILKIVDNEKR